MTQDLRVVIRRLAASPRFTAVAVLTLAVGIAATASTFSVVKGLIVDPLPYPEPDRLAQVWGKDIEATFDFLPLSTPDYLDLEATLTSFEAFGTFTTRRFNIGGERAEAVEGALCTPGVFRAFSVAPLHGRWFTPDDVAGGVAAPVVILSHGFWQQRFASDPGAVGRTLRLDGRDVTIVGVMPEGFVLLSMWTRDRALALWTPLALRSGGGGRANYWMSSVARLAPGVSADGAGAELRAAADAIRKTAPDTNARRTFWLMPLQQGLGGLPALRISVLLGAAWTLLVLAGQNVAGMMFARGVSRQSELAVRVALGASRARIVRLVLAESLAIAGLASGLGLLLTLWAVDAIAAVLPPSVMPRSGLAVDVSVLSCIALLAAIAAQMSGLAPALLASKTDVLTGLKDGGIAVSAGRTERRLRRLVIAQIAIALMLVSVAVQLSQTYQQMLRSSGGLVSDAVVTAAVAVKGVKYDDAARVSFWQRFLAATAALPGVSEAAVTSKLPLDGGVSMKVLIDQDAYDPDRFLPFIETSAVSPRYFQAVGAGLLEGRLFTTDDERAGRRVVVVNRAMSHRYWPGESPIGRRVRPAQADAPWSAEVVGVVEDVRQFAERPPKPELYFSYADQPAPEAFLVVRTAGGVSLPLDAIRKALHRLDADVALGKVTSMRHRFEEAGRVITIVASFVDALTVAILGLAALGLYGTLSFTFARRRRDIGIRIALGAEPRHIVSLVVRQALVWVAIGATLGVAASWVLARGLRAMMQDAGSLDPAQAATSVAIVLVVAAVAAWLPARRAVRIDPIEALRAE